VVWAPAKLTRTLAVVGVRSDGYHELRAEMLSLDLADRLEIEPTSDGASSLELLPAPGSRAEGLPTGPENLVQRALALIGLQARVRLEKRIPVQGGLGGGSADAAAILRWAGRRDLEVASRLGADVPFCVQGGRAVVGGIGEEIHPLPFEERSFVLVVPPFGSDTAAVYRSHDRLVAEHGPPGAWAESSAGNELTAAAVAVEPRLRPWGDALGELTGGVPVLAGSGSTWFVEGEAEALGVIGRTTLMVGGEAGRLLSARAVPAGWSGPEPADR
jgi:4-diphosphocytidyl-2-C-methyl-D-erythritol kinase